MTLATGIPRERCDRINLGYMNPAAVDPSEWDVQYVSRCCAVPRAGELLLRVGPPPALPGTIS